MTSAENANETYCTFTLAGDVTAGGLPCEADIRKDLEDSDPKVSPSFDDGSDGSPLDWIRDVFSFFGKFLS